MMEKVRQILGVAAIESAWVRRQPLWIFQSLVFVIGLIMTLFAWGGEAALKNLMVAYLVIGGWSIGLNTIGQIIGWGRINLTYEFFVASPVTLPIYFAGVVVGIMPYLLIQVVPAFVIAAILNVNFSMFALLLPLSATSLLIGTFTSLSIILRLKNPTNISAITNPLLTFFTFLPPVYYPLTALPSMIRPIVIAIPTVSLMEVGRWSAGVPIGCDLTLSLTSFASWLILTIALVVKKLKWGLE